MTRPVDKRDPFVYRSGVQSSAQAVSDTEDITFYSTEEVADILRISTKTVKRLLKEGELRGIRYGPPIGYRILKDEVTAYLDRHFGARPVPDAS